jgi:predicted flap endonuclease-1-like 5' DNA nuclease
MFTLNPLNNPDALWQHLIMIIGAVVIGYVIGSSSSQNTKKRLEKKLHKLSTDLDRCQLQKVPVQPATQKAPTRLVPATSLEKKDDLKVIEGIGSVIEEVLNSEGIYNFIQLSEIKPDQLVRILQSSGNKFQIHDPRTWPQQAKLAAFEMWDDLKELQNELNRGRYES